MDHPAECVATVVGQGNSNFSVECRLSGNLATQVRPKIRPNR
jgi:hypothetical protein